MDMKIEKPLEKILEKVSGWVDTFISMVPNMAVALLVFIAFMILAKIAQSSQNKALRTLFATITYYIVLGLGLFIILDVLKLDRAVASLLAGIGVVGLALGFAFQNIAANFVSGIILAFRQPFKIGDIVDINSVMGEVTDTSLRATKILTFQGQYVFVPNKDVLENPIINYSLLGKRRIDLAVGVSYAEDLPKVESTVLETINDMEGVVDADRTIFDYYEFGDSSINFYIRFWINYPDQPGFLSVRNNAVKSIKKAFDHTGITIPFPIRTLDFGIKGGKTLSEQHIQLSGQNGSDNQ